MKRTLVCLLLAALGSWVFMSLFPKESTLATKQQFWAEKVHNKTRHAVVLLGNSQVYRGLAPGIISKKLGGPSAINLGFSAGGLNQEIYNFAETRLDTKSPVQIIVLGVSAGTLTPVSRLNKQFRELKRLPEMEVLQRRYINPYLKRFSPVSLSEILQQLQGNPINSSIETSEFYHPDGWVESYSGKLDDEKLVQRTHIDNSDRQVSEALIDEMCARVKSWRDNGIYVFAFRPPTSRRLRTSEQLRLKFNERKIKKKFKHAGGVWINIANFSQYKTYDGGHLLGDSARRLSQYLGARMRKFIDSHVSTAK